MRCLVLILGATLVLPVAAQAESLAEVAAREKARREKLQKERTGAPAATTIGQDEMDAAAEQRRQKGETGGEPVGPSSSGRGPSVVQQPSVPGREGVGEPSDEPTEDVADTMRCEIAARLRPAYRATEQQVAQAEKNLEEAEQRLADSRRRVHRGGRDSSAPYERAVEAARAEIERAKERVTAIEDEARRSGVYPGDLRRAPPPGPGTGAGRETRRRASPELRHARAVESLRRDYRRVLASIRTAEEAVKRLRKQVDSAPVSGGPYYNGPTRSDLEEQLSRAEERLEQEEQGLRRLEEIMRAQGVERYELD